MVDTYKTLGRLIAERLLHTQSKEQRSQSMIRHQRGEGQKTSSKQFQAGMSAQQKATSARRTETAVTQSGKKI